MKVIIACGGTAGHINPAIAVARVIVKNEPSSQILFVGGIHGMEGELVKKAGFDFFGVEMHSFARAFSFAAVKWNIKSFFTFIRAKARLRKLIREFVPQAVLGFGSFASYPILSIAARRRIPTAIHEQNSYPGLANRMIAPRVDIIFLSLEDAGKVLKRPEKTLLVGNPVNPEIFTADRARARAKLSMRDRFCILSFGGSQGAAFINDIVIPLMKYEIERGDCYHIHSVGARDYPDFMKALADSGIDPKSGCLDIREYITDMPDALASADLVIARAGASTIFEIAAAGKGSILIPCPGVTENHQYHNAMALKKVGGALVYEQEYMTAETLIREVARLFSNSSELLQMGVNARSAAYPNSEQLIYNAVKDLIERRSSRGKKKD